MTISNGEEDAEADGLKIRIAKSLWIGAGKAVDISESQAAEKPTPVSERRLSEESGLCREWQPSCNEMLV